MGEKQLKNKSTAVLYICALLFSFGCFQSQVIYFPISIFTFPTLLGCFLIINIFYPFNFFNIKFNFFGVILLIIVFFFALFSKRIDSFIYIVSSILCYFLASYIIHGRDLILNKSLTIFIFINVFFAIFGAIFFDQINLSVAPYALSDSGGYWRFRGASLEPNHLGFSLNIINIINLYIAFLSPKEINKYFIYKIIVTGILIVLTLSPIHILFYTFSITLFYAGTSIFRFISIFLLSLVVLYLIGYERIGLILAGNDNSANFRTWGSFLLAGLAIDKCGIAGCGLGGAKSFLIDEPLLSDFAAESSLVIPNLFAGAIIEGGYIFLCFLILFIWKSTISNIKKTDSENKKKSVYLLFFFLMVYGASGSYPYDAHFYSILGLVNVFAMTHLHDMGRATK